MGFGDTFNFYSYTSDDGGPYAVKLSANIAAKGGFGSPVEPLTVGVWPFHASGLRAVHAVNDTTGQRIRVPMATAAQSLYQSGGTINLHGQDYKVTGAIGEKRKANHIA